MSECLFSYGTLRNDEVQLELFGRLLGGRKDFLRGYKTSLIEITDTAFLANDESTQHLTLIASDNENDSVEGVVFEISDEEILRADAYEPDGYSRMKVVLQSGKEAWVYMAKIT